MKEEEMLDKIKASAFDQKVPDSLMPGKISASLEKVRRSRRRRKKVYYAQMAAAIMVLCLCGYMFYTVVLPVAQRDELSGALDRDVSEMADTRSQQGDQGSTPSASKDSSSPEIKTQEPVHRDAGDSYVVAKDYMQVLETVDKSLEPISYEPQDTDGILESAVTVDDISQNKQLAESPLRYSSTNVQTEGVDESDIAITDGSYLYVRSSQGVEIVDIREGGLKKAGALTLTDDLMGSDVLEMYVDGDRLYLIIQNYNTSLQNYPEEGSEIKSGAGIPETDVQGDVGEARDGAIYLGICGVDDYLMNTDAVVNVLTYDISNRGQPVLIDTMTQDGNYKTSRWLGDILYLFTEKRVNPPVGLSDREKETGDRFIPLVNGERLAADCIYLPESGSTGLIVSSMDVNKPGEIVDNIMILHDSVDIYVSQSAMYLYQRKYVDGQDLTEIAKFSLENGRMDAVSAESVQGTVTDTFAVNEYQGQLRVLTNKADITGKMSNSLYLLDSELKLTGTLENIAEGESIYAARFLGDMAYFVTYRNTDPLFAADLSDSRKPKLLGELKITGFSEYLHFWGEDKLLGIGYETDPDNGEHKGIKLVMFDISDPTDLKVLGNKVVKGKGYSPSLDNGEYKGILADPGENLAGLTTVKYTKGKGEIIYRLFSWEDDDFRSLLEAPVPELDNPSECRGIYVDNHFYVITSEEISSYDRQNDYIKIDSLQW